MPDDQCDRTPDPRGRAEEIASGDAPLHDAEAELEGARAALAQLCSGLRADLVDAHNQLLERDELLDRANAELTRLKSVHNTLVATQAERDRLAQETAELWRAQNEARDIIAERDDEIRRLRMRLARIMDSAPVRVWRRIGRLPLLRALVARRAAQYDAAVGGKDPT